VALSEKTNPRCAELSTCNGFFPGVNGHIPIRKGLSERGNSASSVRAASSRNVGIRKAGQAPFPGSRNVLIYEGDLGRRGPDCSSEKSVYGEGPLSPRTSARSGHGANFLLFSKSFIIQI
jgi:hypothetical protein